MRLSHALIGVVVLTAGGLAIGWHRHDNIDAVLPRDIESVTIRDQRMVSYLAAQQDYAGLLALVQHGATEKNALKWPVLADIAFHLHDGRTIRADLYLTQDKVACYSIGEPPHHTYYRGSGDATMTRVIKEAIGRGKRLPQ